MGQNLRKFHERAIFLFSIWKSNFVIPGCIRSLIIPSAIIPQKVDENIRYNGGQGILPLELPPLWGSKGATLKIF
jgi:hypothetical protein